MNFLRQSMPLANCDDHYRGIRKLMHVAFGRNTLIRYEDTHSDIITLLLGSLRENPSDFRSHVRTWVEVSIYVLMFTQVQQGCRSGDSYDYVWFTYWTGWYEGKFHTIWIIYHWALALCLCVAPPTCGRNVRNSHEGHISGCISSWFYSNTYASRLTLYLYLTDQFIVKYLPSWLPGCGFKRIASRANALVYNHVTQPFDYAYNHLAEGEGAPSFVSDLLNNVENDGVKRLWKSEKEWVDAVKWTAGSMYSAGIDTVCIRILPEHHILNTLKHKSRRSPLCLFLSCVCVCIPIFECGRRRR